MVPTIKEGRPLVDCRPREMPVEPDFICANLTPWLKRGPGSPHRFPAWYHPPHHP